MSSPFDTPDAPASGDRFLIAEHVGELCVINVKGIEKDVETSSGTADVVVADVTVIDGAHAREQFVDVWLFGKVFVGQVKRKVGRTVLGRFGQGEKVAGKTPAWVLNPANEADTSLAIKVMTELQTADNAEPEPARSSSPAAGGGDDTPPWERR